VAPGTEVLSLAIKIQLQACKCSILVTGDKIVTERNCVYGRVGVYKLFIFLGRLDMLSRQCLPLKPQQKAMPTSVG